MNYCNYENDNCFFFFSVRIAQIRWKSMRDAYVKDLKNVLLSINPKRKRYIYHQHLQFLKPQTISIPAGFDVSQLQQDDTDEEEPNSIFRNLKKLKRETNEESGQTSSSTTLQDVLNNHDPTDGDLHFLLSLYNPFKSINSHDKIQAQIDILNVIRKYQ